MKLRRFMKKKNPDIIQSWMYHSNFSTFFIPKIFHDKIFWNIRHSELNFRISKKKTILLSIICGLFSRIIPKSIIYCSKKSIDFHENYHFYSKQKSSLIYNGYNEKNLFPSKKIRLNFRKKNKIKKSNIILGYAGRYAKQKNIPNILKSFSKITQHYNNVYLYMVGKDINRNNKELIDYSNKLKINKKIFFLNEQKNLLEFYNGIDLLILASYSESFPNVIAESMLCSTPVLSSNAGCSKIIINDCGFILAKNDYKSIYFNLKKIINFFMNREREWNLLKKRSRLQIKKNFSIKKMANLYLEKWTY